MKSTAGGQFYVTFFLTLTFQTNKLACLRCAAPLFLAKSNICNRVKAGKLYCTGRLSTVNLLVLTSLYKLLFYNENILYILFFHKTSYLNEEVNCTEPSPSVSIPWSRCLHADMITLRASGRPWLTLKY